VLNDANHNDDRRRRHPRGPLGVSLNTLTFAESILPQSSLILWAALARTHSPIAHTGTLTNARLCTSVCVCGFFFLGGGDAAVRCQSW
jgi:hypothetical protein